MAGFGCCVSRTSFGSARCYTANSHRAVDVAINVHYTERCDVCAPTIFGSAATRRPRGTRCRSHATGVRLQVAQASHSAGARNLANPKSHTMCQICDDERPCMGGDVPPLQDSV